MTQPPAFPLEIHTERLVLRRPTLADVPAIHAIFGDADVMTYWSSGPHQTLEETREWLLPVLNDPVGSAFDLFIDLNGEIIGKMGCWQLPEIGFALARRFWGKGYADEALNAFLASIREAAVCDYLIADVDPRNVRSKMLLERCGFRQSGYAKNTMETHIGWCDSAYYRLDIGPLRASKASSS